jgi:hypothetical protein
MAIPGKNAIVLLAALAFARPIQALPGSFYTRDLAVPAAGWVRVPLDLGALRHMAPGGADLHVVGPDGADIPFRLVAMLSPPGPILTLTARGAKCEHRSTRTVCTLELPAGQILRQVALAIEGSGPVGYRLDEPREARWEPVAEGVWQPGPEGEARRYVLSGGPQPVAGALLRLELYGQDEAPRLTGYALDLAISNVLFRAAVPGRYVLAYGGSGGGSAAKAGRPGSAPVLWVEPGPERASPLPPLPSGLGEQLDRIRFSDAWTVTSPSAEPGQLVRLELPAAVYAAAREDLADLRLSVGGRQVPFFRWSPPDPLLTAGEAGLRPSESDRPGESRVVVTMPAENLPLSQLHLTAPAMLLRRPVSVIYVDPDRRSPRSGRAAREPAARGTWDCVPQEPLPCRERLALRGPAPRLLTVRLRDGDNPRLRAVDVAVWRRRDVLIFVWPQMEEGGEVRLLAGAKTLAAPRYDFAALGPALLARPWEAAEIRSAGEASEAPWWNRWVMPLAIAGAGVWLLVLLRRILSEA